VVHLPAIAGAEAYWIKTVFGQQFFGRNAGEVLHPAREPPAMLEQIRCPLGARVRAPAGWRISDAPDIGEYNFAGQYRQMPAPRAAA
jgi:hypothetical protein